MTKCSAKGAVVRPLLRFIFSLIAVGSLTAAFVRFAPLASATSSLPSAGDEAVAERAGSLLQDLTGVDTSQSVELILLLTVLSLVPSILIMMTSFVRLVIVFSLLRTALGTNQTPPNQVLIGLSLFLTLFIMQPVISEINKNAYEPYKNEEIGVIEMVDRASVPLKEFMLEQVTNDEMSFFLDLAGLDAPENDEWQELSMTVVIPAFITSELKRAFTIGFLIYIPFLIIDIVVSSTLMALGMMMLPPTVISLPFKLLLFILVDGWNLLIGSLVQGFN